LATYLQISRESIALYNAHLYTSLLNTSRGRPGAQAAAATQRLSAVVLRADLPRRSNAGKALSERRVLSWCWFRWLTAAYELTNLFNVTVVDAQKRLGGRVTPQIRSGKTIEGGETHR